MSDYKNTLNLPETGFPMKANLTQREPQRLKQWEEMGLYQKMREAGEGKPTFILHDGPPTRMVSCTLGTRLTKSSKTSSLSQKRSLALIRLTSPVGTAMGSPLS